MVKVKIPRSEDRLLGLLVKINEKHKTRKKNSLLNGAVNMDRLVDKLNKIRSVKDQKPEKNSFSNDFSHRKENDLKFISKEIRSIRNLLLTVYPDEPNILKDWGFELND